MPLGGEPQCTACKIYKSLMWRKGANGETLCNGCHLKRVNSFLPSQLSASSKVDGRRAFSKGKSNKGKSSNGRLVKGREKVLLIVVEGHYLNKK